MGQPALKLPPQISVQEYLEGELLTDIRHEYAAYTVHAMAGASAEHEEIAMTLAADLFQHLDGKPCRVFKGDLKLRLEVNKQAVFYYPDLMVACDPTDNHRYYRERPIVLVEIMSGDEDRDLVEKYLLYKNIASLEEYIVLTQDPKNPKAYVHRKNDNWEQEIIELDGALEIKSLGLTLTLRRIYRSVI